MISIEKALQWYVVFPRGGDQKVHDFLQNKDLKVTKSLPTLTFFFATLEQFYSVLLECPFLSRAGRLLSLDDTVAKDASVEDRLALLDQLLLGIDFGAVLEDLNLQVSVKASGGLNIHEQITAKRAKRAIAARYGVDRIDGTDSEAQLRLTLTEEAIWIGLEVSARSIAQRLSPSRAFAAVKEHLAALVGSYVASDDVELLIDPVCGSGTLLLETLANMTGITRPAPRRVCMSSWIDHDHALWEKVISNAQESVRVKPVRALGFDAQGSAISAAQQNLEAFRQWSEQSNELPVHFERRDLGGVWPKPKQGRAWIVMNPPYGKRLGGGANLAFFYQHLGEKLQSYGNDVFEAGGLAPGYTIIASDIELLDNVRLPYSTQERLYNGADSIFLRTGIIEPKQMPQRAPLQPLPLEQDHSSNELYVQDLAQRFIKNYKKLSSLIAKPEPASRKLPAQIVQMLSDSDTLIPADPLRLFRLYNADLPEYNCAVDVYEHCLYVQEYKAPSTIDPAKAKRRLEQVCFTLSCLFGLPKHRILLKTREQQKGRQQYVRQKPQQGVDKQVESVRPGPLEDWHRVKHVFVMKEWGGKYILNLGDYIDTGLFLDHRRLRWLIRKIASHKHVLNLFSYTGSISVSAALGGAAGTTSVDLSGRYTAWTEHNLMANGCGLSNNQVIRADVVSWLPTHSHQYDLIVIDPPTFSNSKKAQDFVVQDHHEALITAAMKHLQSEGVLFFSCNMKKFELAQVLKEKFVVTEISHWTQSPDFQSKTGPNQSGGHRCWVLRHL